MESSHCVTGLFMVFYNTGARAQEVATWKSKILTQRPAARASHGRAISAKLSTRPETAELLKRLTADVRGNQSVPCSCSSARGSHAFGIYKIVKRHTSPCLRLHRKKARISLRMFRHSTAWAFWKRRRLNVIRAWLDHAAWNHQPLCRNHLGQAGCCEACLPPTESESSHQRKHGMIQQLLKWLGRCNGYVLSRREPPVSMGSLFLGNKNGLRKQGRVHQKPKAPCALVCPVPALRDRGRSAALRRRN